MSWFGSKTAPDTPPPNVDEGGRGRLAGPPSCPRCDLTKAQMNRTIQNYQKAYRKKVEGLKQELHSTRGDVTQLRGQVQRLQRRKRVHLPSLAVGISLGYLAAKHAATLIKRLKERLEARQQSPSAGQEPASA